MLTNFSIDTTMTLAEMYSRAEVISSAQVLSVLLGLRCRDDPQRGQCASTLDVSVSRATNWLVWQWTSRRVIREDFALATAVCPTAW